ncbi:hypothetical protein PMIN04_011855 [Paraphaeosphaeria minitans]
MAGMAPKACQVYKGKKAFEGALVRLVKKVLEDLVREVCKGTAEALDLGVPMVEMEIQVKLVGMARTDVMAAMAAMVGMEGMGEIRYEDGREETKSNEKMTLGLRTRSNPAQQGSDRYSAETQVCLGSFEVDALIYFVRSCSFMSY